MTTDEAIQNMENLAAAYRGTKADHDALEESLNIIRDLRVQSLNIIRDLRVAQSDKEE